MIATLSTLRRPIGRRARAPAATDRPTRAPCVGLALAGSAMLWAALGGIASLLAG